MLIRQRLHALVFCFALIFASESFAQSNLYINVGAASVRKSKLALPDFQNVGSERTATALSLGKEIHSTVFFDLSVSSLFDFISSDAFLEDVNKVGPRPKPTDPNGFTFDSWSQIGTEFLLRGTYRLTAGQIKFEGYLYYVPRREMLLAKSYDGPSSHARTIAHRFAGDVVERLTGKKGIFETKIAAVRSTSNGQKELFVMDWDGKNAQQVTQHQSIVVTPSWAPSGRLLSYSAFVIHKNTKRRNADLFTYDIATKQRKLVSYRTGINSGASFFPDMSGFIMRVSNNGTSDLFHMNMDGKLIKQLTKGPNGAMNVEPAISPDGRRVAFSSDRTGAPMIWVMNVDGTGLERLTHAGKYNSSPSWSPDGSKIVFAGQDTSKFDIFTIDMTGPSKGKLTRLTSAKMENGAGWSNNEFPSFSPDGRHVLFMSNRTGKNQLYITDLQGQNERRITYDAYDYFSPVWGPY